MRKYPWYERLTWWQGELLKAGMLVLLVFFTVLVPAVIHFLFYAR